MPDPEQPCRHHDTATDILPSGAPIITIRPAIPSDDDLVASWLKKYRRQNTKDAFAADVRAFRSFVGLPL